MEWAAGNLPSIVARKSVAKRSALRRKVREEENDDKARKHGVEKIMTHKQKPRRKRAILSITIIKSKQKPKNAYIELIIYFF